MLRQVLHADAYVAVVTELLSGGTELLVFPEILPQTVHLAETAGHLLIVAAHPMNYSEVSDTVPQALPLMYQLNSVTPT